MRTVHIVEVMREWIKSILAAKARPTRRLSDKYQRLDRALTIQNAMEDLLFISFPSAAPNDLEELARAFDAQDKGVMTRLRVLRALREVGVREIKREDDAILGVFARFLDNHSIHRWELPPNPPSKALAIAVLAGNH